jgi:menaquinone-dependent protoporphyrinogen oxidase
MKILVAYASRHGSTAEISQTIGEVLQQRGFEVDVQDVEQTNQLTGYDAFVFGSALYAGDWMKSAAECVIDKQEMLQQKPVWLFSSGPTGQGNPSELLDGWMFKGELLEAVKKIQPRDIVFFHGKIDLDVLNFAERRIVESVKAPAGDYRQWRDIKAWAEQMDFVTAV